MTERERVRAVFEGRRPDRVPLMLDLSHWYKKNHGVPFRLSGMTEVDDGLVRLHRQVGAVCYVEMGSFYAVESEDPERWGQALEKGFAGRYRGGRSTA